MTPKILTNITYEELSIGQTATLIKSVTEADILLFAYMSGDVNPAHLDPEYAKTTIFKDVIMHGMWSASLISTVLGTKLPGPGAIYLKQDLQFLKPIYIGDKITVTVEVVEKKERRKVILKCTCTNQHNNIVTSGMAEIIAPDQQINCSVPILSEHIITKTNQG